MGLDRGANLVGIFDHLSLEEQEWRGRETLARRASSVIISLAGQGVLQGAVVANRRYVRMNKAQLAAPDKKLFVQRMPTNIKGVFMSRYVELCSNGGLASLPVLSELEINNRLRTEPDRCFLPLDEDVFEEVVDAAVDRKTTVNGVADAIAQNSYPDYEAIAVEFGLDPPPQPLQLLRLVSAEA